MSVEIIFVLLVDVSRFVDYCKYLQIEELFSSIWIQFFLGHFDPTFGPFSSIMFLRPGIELPST